MFEPWLPSWLYVLLPTLLMNSVSLSCFIECKYSKLGVVRKLKNVFLVLKTEISLNSLEFQLRTLSERKCWDSLNLLTCLQSMSRFLRSLTNYFILFMPLLAGSFCGIQHEFHISTISTVSGEKRSHLQYWILINDLYTGIVGGLY